MKKFLLMFALVFTVLGANGQVAYEKAKLFDNVYVGVKGGISSSFDHVTPFNANAGLLVGKDWTPILGTELEGTAWFNDNSSEKFWVNKVYVGLHPTIDLTNLFAGYNADRVFTAKVVAGFGWITNFSHTHDTHDLGMKSGVRLGWNVGAFQLGVEPSVYWNLTKYDGVKFNKNNAQLALNAVLIYKFKTSNGTRGFKSYNIGSMNELINTLHAENAKLRTAASRIPNEIIRTDTVNSQYFVFFAQNSIDFDQDAIDVLNSVPTDAVVEIVASASPEGAKEYNKKLSERRAQAVADFLSNRGIKIKSAKGIGNYSNTSNRVAAIVIK